jgi:predicted transcriptional regulator
MDVNIPTPKQRARTVIDQLPDTASWQDIVEALAVEDGLSDLRAGRVLDGDQVMHWLESWGTEHESAPPSCGSSLTWLRFNTFKEL